MSMQTIKPQQPRLCTARELQGPELFTVIDMDNEGPWMLVGNVAVYDKRLYTAPEGLTKYLTHNTVFAVNLKRGRIEHIHPKSLVYVWINATISLRP